MKLVVEAHAQRHLEPLQSYYSSNRFEGNLSIPNQVASDSVIGIYFNEASHFVVITGTTLYIYRNELWFALRYDDIYYVKGPSIEGDTVDKRLQIIDKTGKRHEISILGDTVKPSSKIKFVEMDIWQFRQFLRRVTDDVRENQIYTGMKFNKVDERLVSDLESLLTSESNSDINLAHTILIWMKFGIEVEQGYRFTIYEYTDALMTRNFLSRFCDSLSPHVRHIVIATIEPIDHHFAEVTNATPYPILGPSPKEWWWYRIPTLLTPEFREDLQSWRNEWLEGDIIFANPR